MIVIRILCLNIIGKQQAFRTFGGLRFYFISISFRTCLKLPACSV